MAIMDYPQILNDRPSKDVMKYSKMRVNPLKNIKYLLYIWMILNEYLSVYCRIYKAHSENLSYRIHEESHHILTFDAASMMPSILFYAINLVLF